MKYHIELHNLNGLSYKKCRVYNLPVNTLDYWANVTDILCPIEKCEGIIRWAEAGYVPGYRICDKCGCHFLASGNSKQPKLIRFGQRKSKV